MFFYLHNRYLAQVQENLRFLKPRPLALARFEESLQLFQLFCVHITNAKFHVLVDAHKPFPLCGLLQLVAHNRN